jgi:glycosyltransferase involved in cell wall biosynthesis
MVRVVTSCSGRFHIFDQARELAQQNLLHQLITDYPPSYAARFGVPARRVKTLIRSALVTQGLRRIGHFLSPEVRSRAFEAAHNIFSRQLARALPSDTGFFIGLSSFCLEALRRARELGIPAAVDHGSLHQADDREIVVEESRRWGCHPPADTSPDWIIEKEIAEFREASHVWVLSSVARDSLVKHGTPIERIFVNPCGVDLSSFTPGEAYDSVFRVIQVGSLSLRKGTLHLMDAFRRAAIPKAELWFVGELAEASELAPLIERLRVPGMRFIDAVPQARLRDLYVQSSVFVLASLADGFGMVVPQAMACGLPVIVTSNVGAKDLVRDGYNGFLVPTCSADAIAERLRMLHADPELRRQMGVNARRTVASGYSWGDYGARLAGFIRSHCAE